MKTFANVMIKWGKGSFKKKQLDDKFSIRAHKDGLVGEQRDMEYFVESQLILEKNTGVIMLKYSDMMIQLGYVVMFA